MKNLYNSRNIYEADWQGKYVFVENWKSDIIFYKEDLNFLWNLKDKIKELNKKDINAIQPLLTNINNKSEVFLLKIDHHLSRIANIIDTPFKYDSYLLRAEHEQLENEFLSFIKNFRNSKAKVLLVLEKLIKSKELAH